MQVTQPHTYPSRILLAATGLSPQVVTETLYALAVTGHPPFIPTEIHLITTIEGARRAKQALLDQRHGRLFRLITDYQLPPLSIADIHIHLLPSRSGEPLADIRTPEDNLASADFITQRVRELTRASDTAMHVSIAGGRKTMGFLLGYALSLFGRPQDRLSHILVSEPYESSTDFFYPTPYAHAVRTAQGSLVDAQDAQLTLADIPFVSLRHGLPATILNGTSGFEAAVDAMRANFGPARLRIHLTERTVEAGAFTFTLPPAELALLAVFARRATNAKAPLSGPPKDSPDPAWAKRYLRELRLIVGPLGDLTNTERALRHGMDGAYFSSRLSKLRASLREKLGPSATPYLIDDGGARPRRYCLMLIPGDVEISP